MSTRIATTHVELESLRHRGERSFYEFTLQKGASPVVLAGVKLQLKRTDERRSRYVLVLSADDKNMEKNRSLNEPLQFYAGRDHVLYELVVSSIAKDRIVGSLSTPKTLAQASVNPQ